MRNRSNVVEFEDSDETTTFYKEWITFKTVLL